MAIKLDVTREVELESQVRQVQKLESIGQLAGGVAHDFNNILAGILMQVELLAMSENRTSEDREGLDQIRADAQRAANLTRQLLLFSRKQVMQPRNLDLNEVVTGLARMLLRIIGEDVQLQLNLHSTPLLTHADAGMLDQVLMNLVVNARDALHEGGQIFIETSDKIVDETLAQTQPDVAPGHYVCLSVRDTGGGIPPEVLPRIFEPFFTTKEAGKGTGLGLATVFGIVKQHRGWLTVSSEPGQGTTFHIFLPAITAAAAPAAAALAKPRGGTETILLAEDEASVRRTMRTILERSGYTVLEATSGAEALKIWEAQSAGIALLLSDLVMSAGMKVIYITGYSAEIAGQAIELRSNENFLQKPFQPDQLLETIRRCLDGR
jgi:nitrogen-specific signal transduction histidine kinase/CheY-like chemotaxis protein